MILKFKPVPKKRLIKSKFMFPIKLNTKQSVRKIQLKNLTWPQASIRFPRLNPFGDKDRDGKLNMFDCHPFDRKRHSAIMRDEIVRRVFKSDENIKEPYKKIVKMQKMMEPSLREEYFEAGREIYRKRGVLMISNQIPKFKEKFRKETKIIGPREVVKHLEKHPQLIKDFEKIDLYPLSKEDVFNTAEFAQVQGKTFKDNIKVMGITPYMIKKRNVGEIMEHELSHIEQYKEDIPFKEKRKNIKAIKNYEALPSEMDVEEKRIRRREEWDSWKKEKPETLRQLDTNDNQIPDTAEDVNIEPIEEENED
jgi:hypothetical protein